MNLLKEASLPVNFWTSLTFFGTSTFRIALTFSGFGSVPFAETMHPRIFPFWTPKPTNGCSALPELLRSIYIASKVDAKSMSAELPPSIKIFDTVHPSMFASITIVSMCG